MKNLLEYSIQSAYTLDVRRHYITHPQFQFTFTLFFGLGTLLVLLLLGATMMGSLGLLAFDPLISEQQRAIVTRGLSSMFGMWALIGFISLCVFTFLGFYLSYKFVGPLYRLENWLEQNIQQPTDQPLKLRPGDELENMVRLLQERVLVYKKKKL